MTDEVTLSPATDEDIREFLRWAVAEMETLKTTLITAEYGSQEWFDALHDLPFIEKRVSYLMQALSRRDNGSIQ